MVNYTRRAVRGTIVVFINLLFAALLMYLVRMVLARSLTPAEFGLFYATHTIVFFLIFFRSLGINPALVKYIPEFKMRKRFGEIKSAILASLIVELAVALIFILLIFLFSNFLSVNYFRTGSSVAVLLLFSLYFLLSIPYFLAKDILRGFQKITVFSFADTVNYFFVLIITVILLSLGFGLIGAVIGFLGGAALTSLIFIIVTNRTFSFFKYKAKDFGKTLKKMIFFGLPILLSGVGDKVIGYFDVLMLIYYSTLEKVGIYNVALPLALMLTIIGYSVSWVLYPMVSELSARKDKKRLKLGLDFTYRYVFVIIIPAALAAFAFSDLLIEVLFTENYLPASMALKILIIGAALYTVARVNFNFIAGIGKPKTISRIIILSALINIMLNLILIPLYSIEGAAVATTVSYSLCLILSTNRVSKFIKYRLPLAIWLKTLCIGIIFLATLMLADFVNAGMIIKLGALWLASVIYLVLAILLKLIDLKEIRTYLKA